MRRVVFLILLVALLTACVTDFLNEFDRIGSVNWNPTLGIPVAGGTFTVEDYLNTLDGDIVISQDADGVIAIEYAGPEIASEMAEDMINIPNQAYNSSVNFASSDAGGFPVSLTLVKQLNFDFVVDTEDNDLLDSMIFKSGILDININGDFPASGQVELIFNSITLNGSTFSRIYNWTYNPTKPGQFFQESIDLQDAFIDYTKNNTTTNNFNFDVVFTIFYEGQAISATNSVDIGLSLTNPRFKIVYGKFAQRMFTTPKESVLLGILEKVNAVNFVLDNPQINLNFKSSFGLPVRANLNALVALNSNGDSLAFTGPVVTSPIAMASPSTTEIGSFVETEISINRDNSNIIDIISFLPSELVYQFDGSVDSQNLSVEQFVLDTSQVIGSYNVKLPLSGRVSEFSTEKEFKFDGSDLDLLNETKVRLHTINGLPVTVSVQLVFLDENDNPLDTLFAGDNILDPGVVDSEGLVIALSDNTVEANYTGEEVEILWATRKVIMMTSLFTGLTGNENVKIRAQDEVNVSIYIQTAIKF